MDILSGESTQIMICCMYLDVQSTLVSKMIVSQKIDEKDFLLMSKKITKESIPDYKRGKTVG